MFNLKKSLIFIIIYTLISLGISFSINIYAIKDKNKNSFIELAIINSDDSYFYLVCPDNSILKLNKQMNLVNSCNFNLKNIRFYYSRQFFVPYNQNHLIFI